MSREKKQEKDIVLNQKVKNKGQALVEFVIILPIIMIIIFVIIDFSNVFYQKNNLESIMNSVVTYKENGKSNEYIKNQIKDDVKITYEINDENLTINISKDIKLITPFSSMFFESPYTISTERIILYE